MLTKFFPTLAVARTNHRFIYIASPQTPMGGGMYKVSDYLVQSQGLPNEHTAELVPLETRGPGSALWSLAVLCKALVKIVLGRISGNLAGVHVNMGDRLSLVRKGFIVVTARSLGLPVVLHLHVCELHHTYKKFPSPVRAGVRTLFSLANGCVVLGKVSLDFVTRELKVPTSRVDIVINGVPAPTLARRIASSDPNRRQRVLFVGNLSNRKGVADMLQALAKPQFKGVNLEVIFLGGGDVMGYRALAGRLGLSEWVSFRGWVNQDIVSSMLASADALVLPSYEEGLPLVILEALSHGVAVVCTPVGEIPNTLTDGVHACFVEPGNIESLAQGMFKVLSDSEFREMLAREGQQLHEQSFSISQFVFNISSIHKRHFGICAASSGADDSSRLNA